MLRKYALFVGVAALGALVTSCGGGGGTPTPTESPSGTATPTPTPSPVNFDLSQAFATESANANLAFAWFQATGAATETFNGGSRVNGNSTIALAFSPESVTFGNPDLADPVTFSGAQLTSSSATQRTYERTNERLLLERPFEHVLRVNYQLQAPFTRNSVAGTLRSQKVSLFFNRVTATGGIDTNLSYTGSVQVAGGDPGVTLSNAISAANVTFTVNAADDSISGTIQIFQLVSGTPQLVTTLVFQKTSTTTNGTTTVTGGVFAANGTISGILTDTTNKFEGNFVGALAGPNRDELFLIFSVTGNTDANDDRRFVGSFIGS